MPKTKKAKEYRVVWEIDITADSPQQAAEIALEIQRDSASMATHFQVFGHKGVEGAWEVYL